MIIILSGKLFRLRIPSESRICFWSITKSGWGRGIDPVAMIIYSAVMISIPSDPLNFQGMTIKEPRKTLAYK